MQSTKVSLVLFTALFVAPWNDCAAAQPGQQLWEFPTGGPVNGCPAIGTDGTVYVGSDKVYALNGATGQERWEFQRSFH